MSASLSSDAKVIAVCVEVPDENRARNLKNTAAKTSSTELPVICNVAVWKVDTRKFIASKEIEKRVTGISINPEDGYLICVVGERICRYLKCVGNDLDEIPLLKRTKERSSNFTLHKWIDSQTLALVCHSSEIYIFVKGELVQTIDPIHTTNPEHPIPSVTCLAAHNDGFIVGTSAATLRFYRPQKNAGTALFSQFKEMDTERGVVQDIILSPSKKHLVAVIKVH